uniref:Phosphoprotein n=1 Tax=Otomys rat paramyxovirus TaxID=3141898 RepID=A0AAU7E4P4_9MONO
METNCQKAIKDALKILAVVKETKSPQSEEELRERIITGERDKPETPITSETPGKDGNQEESRSSRGGTPVKGSETSTSYGFITDTERDGSRVQTSNAREPISDGIHNTAVRKDNFNEGIGGDPCYVMLGEASRGCLVPDRLREGELPGSGALGEDDDGGPTGLIRAHSGYAAGEFNREMTNEKKETKDREESGEDIKKIDDSSVMDNMNTDDIKEALGAPPTARPRRLTNLDAAVASSPSITFSRDNIKRGIDGSTTLSGQMKASQLSHGAIQSAQGLDLFRGEKGASVGNAQSTVRNVPSIYPQIKAGQIIGVGDSTSTPRKYYQSSEISGLSSFEGSGKGSIIDADSSVLSDSPLALINDVLDNQRLIIDKLKLLDEIKHEVEGIKRVILKHSLTLSTLEGQLSSVMIAIPSSGSTSQTTELNPDLKPLLGRDKCRGITDVGKSRTQNISFDDEHVGRSTSVSTARTRVELKSGILPPEIDPNRTNATGFKPTNTIITREIITALIDTRIKDKELNGKMKRLLTKAKNQRELCELHKAIIEALKRK